ncbi:bifunctional protein-serine/threonine kinase/phosphatase [Neorhizobium huautlense]|uniref:bifunctional protein-serine/threonine kinase/phosphatase n=1 Tax=Neorhizobium huautlense TaxID=67774 RepID=UPI000CF84CB5|nr:bifunctional protein-serine/threonine kinase/phosphatase [Neorhizobium huautlense]
MLQSLAPGKLKVDIGQYSAPGRKAINQDFHGAIVPEGAVLAMKGVALAIADGISSSPVSHIAAETAVKSFLTDYYCTSDAWTVKTAASRVIDATNSWLHAQNRGVENLDRAHVTTFSALVLKGRWAHIFHMGDSRIWRMSGGSLEPLTSDHRLTPSQSESYLGRALGLLPSVEIDYHRLDIHTGDVFVLTTDGIHAHVAPRQIAARLMSEEDLSAAAKDIAASAYEAGSDDNLTIQVVRIDNLPDNDFEPVFDLAGSLPPAPLPRIPGDFEEYRLHRQIHASSRSHIFLATEPETGENVVLKFPSADLREDENYLRRFAMEEWVARRVSSIHVLKSRQPLKPRRSLYLVMDYVEGETLAQWMADRPKADLRSVRDIVGQIANGLRALHRKEIIHQDLRPENIMIDRSGTVKIIDFGSAAVAGVIEAAPSLDDTDILGTVQYAAPEYFAGERGSEQSDLYSLGAIAYHMLTGRLPYGPAVARTRSKKEQRKLRFAGLREIRPDVPDWVEEAIRKAVDPDPAKRYTELSEFEYDLSHPNAKLLGTRTPSLIERNPLLFWKVLSLILGLIIIGLLARDFI